MEDHGRVSMQMCISWPVVHTSEKSISLEEFCPRMGNM